MVCIVLCKYKLEAFIKLEFEIKTPYDPTGNNLRLTAFTKLFNYIPNESVCSGINAFKKPSMLDQSFSCVKHFPRLYISFP